jgi:anti-sigma28 factor (negative regulator of flagellin synthesis)
MRIERNAKETGASQSDAPANTDSPPALETQNGTGLDNDQTQPSTEHLLADLFLMDPTEAEALVAQLGPSPENRRLRITALQNAIADGTYQVSPEQTAEAILLRGKSGRVMQRSRGEMSPRTHPRTYISLKASLTFCKSDTAENGLGR